MEHEQAITDLINFIAEFELWLEAESLYEAVYDTGGKRPMKEALIKYRECKKRIEYDNGTKESE